MGWSISSSLIDLIVFGVWIWNWFRVRLNWKILNGNFNITIINGMMIKSPHDILNHRIGFGRRVPGFEVSVRRLSVPFYWWFIWFFTMKCIELINLSPTTWWEELCTMDDSCISFVSNYSTSFTNTLLSRAESCNNCPEEWCIIVDVIWRAEIMRAPTLSGQCCWISNHI